MHIEKVKLETSESEPLSTGMYPWQKYFDVEVWGREGYYMPNMYTSVDSMGLPQRVIVESESVKPIYYIQAGLQDFNYQGERTKYHIVIDENGFMWLDEDGTFNDSRFTKKMQNDSVLVSSKRVDDIDTNNTLGPFMLKGLEVVDSETFKSQFNTEDMLGERNWYILEYITINNDVIGKFNYDQTKKVTAFFDESMKEKVDFNVFLLIDIFEYSIP